LIVDLNEPLPRLMRLRGMVARSVPPDDAKITHSDAAGLADAYIRLRESVRSVAVDLGADNDEFASVLPPLEPPRTPSPAASVLLKVASEASRAANLLRSLAGYVEGLIEAVVLEQQITMEQVQAAREAARQPPGFR
jgi:hypothetical protein